MITEKDWETVDDVYDNGRLFATSREGWYIEITTEQAKAEAVGWITKKIEELQKLKEKLINEID